jgi:hypothetical protein
MAYYAFLDKNNIVTEVIPGKDEGEDGIDWEVWYGEFRGQTCKRTSYNTQHGIHKLDGTPFRKNYAGIGFKYDAERDAFITPQPWPSWTLNEETCQYDPPVPYPRDESRNVYVWNEEKVTWERLLYPK